MERSGNPGNIFFQDGSWLELRTGCHLSEGEEFCAPSTGSQLVSPFPRPAQHTGSSASGQGPAPGANPGQWNAETRVTDPGLRPGPVTRTPGAVRVMPQRGGKLWASRGSVTSCTRNCLLGSPAEGFLSRQEIHPSWDACIPVIRVN